MKHTHTLPPILLIGLLLTPGLPLAQVATNCATVTAIPQAQCFVVLEQKLVFLNLFDNPE
jgi:hypothetical protein